jgi:hypothetical protein
MQCILFGVLHYSLAEAGRVLISSDGSVAMLQ